MRLMSWFLRKLSNEDCSTDLIEYALIASLLTLGLVATYGELVYRILAEYNTISNTLSNYL